MGERPSGTPLSFIGPDGVPQMWLVRTVDDPAVNGRADHSPIRTRLLASNEYARHPELIVERRLTAATADPAVWRRHLDGEVGAGLRLYRRPAGGVHPALPRVVGYQMDADEPFVLWACAPGSPLRSHLGRLDQHELSLVVRDLFQSLAVLADAGIVHRSINPDTVHWTGAGAVIATMATATLAGDPRVPTAAPRWSPPEQRNGESVADPRDDVYGAAVLIGDLFSGAAHGIEVDASRMGRRLAALIPQTLEPRAAMRPDAAAVLLRLQEQVPVPARTSTDQLLAEGGEHFERMVRQRTVPAPRTPAPEQKKRHWFRFWKPVVPAQPVRRRPANACYFCLSRVEWDERDLHVWVDGGFEPLDAANGPLMHVDQLRNAYKRCPSQRPDEDPHFLPVEYLRNGPAINVGIIGGAGAGKSHLLAGIIREIDNDVLAKFGVSARAVDIGAHEEFRVQRIVQLYNEHKVLPATPVADSVNFADGVMLASGTVKRPLMFFDVAGESLLPDRQLTQEARFVAAIDALIFVVEADATLVDTTFTATLDRLDHRVGTGNLLDVPAVVVITKCDRVRFVEPVDRWIRQPNRAELVTAAERHAESRDGYAYLYARRLNQLLTPVSRCRQFSLHFASATGAEPVNKEFPRGAEGQRCLSPLLSLLRMTGVLPEPPAVTGG